MKRSRGPESARFIAPATLARMLGVSTRTVTRWCRQGRIEGAEQFVGPHTTWRIPLDTLERFGVSEMSEMSQMSESGAERVPDANVES